MTDLIERLEKAEGPSRELDIEIAVAVGHRPVDFGTDPYTASVDASMTLVPAGWEALLYTETGMAELYDARLKRRRGIKARSECTTLPLSICAAALRARETTHD